MRDGTVSIDRREGYYERCASLIAKDPLGFYVRAEAGRRIQNALRPNLSYLELCMRVAGKRELADMEEVIFGAANQEEANRMCRVQS